MKKINVYLQASATEEQIEEIIYWLEKLPTTGAVYVTDDAAQQKRAVDLPNEPLCICGKPISKHQGVVCLPESANH